MSACFGSERVLEEQTSQSVAYINTNTHSYTATEINAPDKYKTGYSLVYDIGVDLSQGLDLDYTEAAVRDNSISVSHSV